MLVHLDSIINQNTYYYRNIKKVVYKKIGEIEYSH